MNKLRLYAFNIYYHTRHHYKHHTQKWYKTTDTRILCQHTEKCRCQHYAEKGKTLENSVFSRVLKFFFNYAKLCLFASHLNCEVF